MMSRPLAMLLASCLTPLLLVALFWSYARVVEPRWVEETHWELRAEHWKGRPLRLAVLADLHARPGDGAYLDRLVARTLAAQPDVVLLLGDYVNNPAKGESMEPEQLSRHLSPLMQVPCFAVLGNHDRQYGVKAMRRMLEDMGACVLEGKVHALPIGGDVLHLGGICHLEYYSWPQKLEDPLPGDEETFIMLMHCPPGYRPVTMGHTATLCGHRHGGQLCLPGGISFMRIDRRLPQEILRGVGEKNGKLYYVSRGLGMSRLRLRFCSRPELLFVELVPGQEGGEAKQEESREKHPIR